MSLDYEKLQQVRACVKPVPPLSPGMDAQSLAIHLFWLALPYDDVMEHLARWFRNLEQRESS